MPGIEIIDESAAPLGIEPSSPVFHVENPQERAGLVGALQDAQAAGVEEIWVLRDAGGGASVWRRDNGFWPQLPADGKRTAPQGTRSQAGLQHGGKQHPRTDNAMNTDQSKTDSPPADEREEETAAAKWERGMNEGMMERRERP